MVSNDLNASNTPSHPFTLLSHSRFYNKTLVSLPEPVRKERKPSGSGSKHYPKGSHMRSKRQGKLNILGREHFSGFRRNVLIVLINILFI